MLNIGKLAHGGENYYLSTVAVTVEAYYTGSGEAPGKWTGATAELLDLNGRVDAESLRALLAGRHPITGEKLVAQQRTVPGFDLTFRAPKSVSLVWALADDHTSLEVRQAHDTAVAAALDYVERHAAFTRRGHGGVEQVPIGGFVAATFRHRTSRADDPLLHTHVLVANLAHTGDDNTWRTLDARHLYLHAKTAGYLYQAQLRHELTTRLGIEWGPVRNGYADIDGVPRDVIEVFSRRRSQIVAELARVGHSSAHAAQVATLATRPAKTTCAVEDLRQRWRDRAHQAGFGRDAVDRLIGRDVADEPDRAQLRRRASVLLGPSGLTANASTFTRRDAIQGWCLQLDSGAPVGRVERFADHLLDGTGETIRLTGATTPVASLAYAGIRRADGRFVATPEARYTTPELLAIEQRLVDAAASLLGSGLATVDPALVETTLASRGWLTDEQADAVRRLTLGGDGVAVVVGRAGSGKTSMLDVARQVWEDAGIPVVGAALAARAALELRNGAGIDATSIERLLNATAGPGRGLPAGGVLVVDEAGMVGTRTLAQLVDLAVPAGCKVVLVGDHHQLPEIDAGGAFSGLVNRLSAIELTHNRRQHAPWEVDALDELRNGDINTAVSAYSHNDSLTVADTVDAAREQLVGDWWQAAAEHGTDAVMIAARQVDIDDLNARARDRVGEAGHLTGSSVTAAGLTFQTGDRILCLRNHNSVGVLNGTRATVTDVNPATRTVTAVRDDTGDTVTLPPVYLDAGWVDHGYALTAHKAQGLTCEAAFVLADDRTYREWGYVAMSRGRTTNRLYLVTDPDDHDAPDDPTHAHVLQTDERPAPERLVAELQRSHRQALALDHLPDADAHERQANGEGGDGVKAKPTYTTKVLGPRPDDARRQNVWDGAAAAIENYRTDHHVTDRDQPLGPLPDDREQLDAYRAAMHAVIEARRRLGAGRPAQEVRRASHEFVAEIA